MIDQLPSPALVRSTPPRGRLFHGTSNNDAARAILRDGVVKAPTPAELDARYGRSHQRPVAGRVYLTTSLRYCSAYVFNGCCAGTSMVRDAEQNPDGFLFVIDGSEIGTADLQPDEDELGKLPWLLSNLDFASKQTVDSSECGTLAALLVKEPGFRVSLTDQVRRFIPAYTFRKASDGLCSWQSKAGKILLNRLGADTLQRLSGCFPNKAVAGAVRWSEAWRIDKRSAKAVRPDCSNFFEIAQRVN